MPTQPRPSLNRMVVMTALIAAGETIFLLPFVIVRIFRPTFLDVFGLTNLQLGTAFSLYSVVAMVSYFAGGPLADRFPARRLMAAALAATSLGGVFLATIPPLAKRGQNYYSRSFQGLPRFRFSMRCPMIAWTSSVKRSFTVTSPLQRLKYQLPCPAGITLCTKSL